MTRPSLDLYLAQSLSQGTTAPISRSRTLKDVFPHYSWYTTLRTCAVDDGWFRGTIGGRTRSAESRPVTRLQEREGWILTALCIIAGITV